MNLLEDLIEIDNTEKQGLVGLNDEFFSLYLNKYYKETKKDIIIVTSSLYEANQLNNTLSTYTEDVALFPMDDFLTCESIAQSPELKLTRLETINNILRKEKHIIITHLDGYLRFLPTKEKYLNSIIKLKKGQEYKREDLIENLMNIGYVRDTIVSKTGELGVRGFVIDVFPIEKEHPIRVEFFGDEIDSIREFDEENQKTLREIDDIEIYPKTEFLPDDLEDGVNNQKYLRMLSEGIASISEYLDNPTTVFKNIKQIESAHLFLQEQISEYRQDRDENYSDSYMFNLYDIKINNVIYYNTIDNIIDGVQKNHIHNYSIKDINNFN
jgi:transcription-repair coupling factor (superfamily II helicase)